MSSIVRDSGWNPESLLWPRLASGGHTIVPTVKHHDEIDLCKAAEDYFPPWISFAQRVGDGTVREVAVSIAVDGESGHGIDITLLKCGRLKHLGIFRDEES